MSDDFIGVAFIGVYLLVLTIIFAGVIYKLVRPFLAGRLKMSVDRAELARGETLRVEVEVPKNTRRLDVELRAEEMYETSGKHSKLYTEIAYQDARPMSGSMISGKVAHTFEIPKSAPPSIGPYDGGFIGYVRRVGLRWYVHAKADLPNALDKEGRVDIKVE